MKRNQKNLFFLLLILTLTYIYSYRTTYNEYDNKSIINNVSNNLQKNQELLVFESKNPFNFYDVINNLDIVSNQIVYGILTYPKIKKDKYKIF